MVRAFVRLVLRSARDIAEQVRAVRLRMDEINNGRKEEEERIELAMEEVAATIMIDEVVDQLRRIWRNSYAY